MYVMCLLCAVCVVCLCEVWWVRDLVTMFSSFLCFTPQASASGTFTHLCSLNVRTDSLLIGSHNLMLWSQDLMHKVTQPHAHHTHSKHTHTHARVPTNKRPFVHEIPVHRVNFVCMFFVASKRLLVRCSNIKQFNASVTTYRKSKWRCAHANRCTHTCSNNVVFVFFAPCAIINAVSCIKKVYFYDLWTSVQMDKGELGCYAQWNNTSIQECESFHFLWFQSAVQKQRQNGSLQMG